MGNISKRKLLIGGFIGFIIGIIVFTMILTIEFTDIIENIIVYSLGLPFTIATEFFSALGFVTFGQKMLPSFLIGITLYFLIGISIYYFYLKYKEK